MDEGMDEANENTEIKKQNVYPKETYRNEWGKDVI